MIEITPETMRRAIERAGKMRCRGARRLDDDKIELTCAHGHRHVITFTHSEGKLFAECFMPETGEMCPSEMGRRACYHLAAAVAVRDAIESVRVAALRSQRKAAPTRPLPQLSTKQRRKQEDDAFLSGGKVNVGERVRGFQI